jgi:hypothetical protein
MVQRGMGDRGVACGRGRPPHQRPGDVSTEYAQICSIGVHFDNSATFMSRTHLVLGYVDNHNADAKRGEILLVLQAVVDGHQNIEFILASIGSGSSSSESQPRS